MPVRRTARCSLDELVAAAYLLYPRYLDHETGLPCPPKVLVQRLTSGPPLLDLILQLLPSPPCAVLPAECAACWGADQWPTNPR